MLIEYILELAILNSKSRWEFFILAFIIILFY